MSTTREERIRKILAKEFTPEHLDVKDVSEAHRGHAGWREGGGTHFHIRMKSAALGGLSRVERQRRVNRALRGEFEAGMHAVSMDLEGG